MHGAPLACATARRNAVSSAPAGQTPPLLRSVFQPHWLVLIWGYAPPAQHACVERMARPSGQGRLQLGLGLGTQSSKAIRSG